MKLVFFGTPDFAARSLKRIIKSDHNIAAVVTAPDKPSGRGRKVKFSDVKQLAMESGLNIFQPSNLKDPEFIDNINKLNADIFIVVAFRILPEVVFGIPPEGSINLHASLLPKYRGAAPINWALINGEKETGLTTFFIREKVDTGEIIEQLRISISPDENFGELYDRLADMGGDLLLSTIDNIEKGDIQTTLQNESEASPAPKIYSELGRIDWTKPADEVHNLIRGLSPKPGAFGFLNNEKVKILKTEIENGDFSEFSPGEIVYSDPKQHFTAACGKDALKILEIKPESRKIITGAEFVRGKRIKAKDSFEIKS